MTADIKGTVNFSQRGPEDNVFINVKGLEGLKSGLHGFHIHANDNCKDPGSHFNPKMVILKSTRLKVPVGIQRKN